MVFCLCKFDELVKLVRIKHQKSINQFNIFVKIKSYLSGAMEFRSFCEIEHFESTSYNRPNNSHKI